MRRGTTTILVVDDDQEFRGLVSELLARAGYEMTEASAGDEALVAATTRRPALALVDVRLPRLSGYEVCRQLKDAFGNQFPVIFVSGERTESFDRAGGLLLGGDEYLVKPIEPDDLLARIRKYVAPDQGNDVENADLTPREREILDLLADGLTQHEIARQLTISPKTVGTHIQHVLSKLGVHSRAQAVAAAHRLRMASMAR